MRVLILGGYGTFGGRLVKLLADEARLTLIVTGRSLAKAAAFADSVAAEATLIPCTVDRNGDLSKAFARLRPDIVVDASGPFQIYGERPYAVVEACIAAGSGYLDLADGTDFVAGISRHDTAARERGVFMLSGVSTFPALSSAVVRHLSKGWDRVEGIEACLAPSPKAGLGGNVVRAILSYAGKPLAILRDGGQAHAPALIDARRRTIAPPGVLPLSSLRFTLIDVPDLRLAPEQWPDLRDLWVGVATRPQFLQRCLGLCARAVQWRLLRSLSVFSGLAEWTMRTMPWGAHRGGMALTVRGLADGEPVARRWHMIAEGDDGPFIPAMAAEALIRKTLDGAPPAPGARPAIGAVDLADYEAAFTKRHIATGIVEGAANGPLYRRMLGDVWHRLPEPIRALHAAPDDLFARGTARVDRDNGLLSRLVGALVGFPKAGTEIPVEVCFTVRDGGELWERSFAGKRFFSFQKEGSGRFDRLLSERFGPLEFGLALVAEENRLHLVTRGWRAFGVPMPRFLAPGGKAFEHAADGRFNFHVEISHPLTGLIVRYRGWLVPVQS